MAPAALSLFTKPDTEIAGVTTAELPVKVIGEGERDVTVKVSALAKVKITDCAVADS